ncbi:MAG: ribonucleoside-diphosphate reductase subunit alpha, partial [Clostridiales bacterium]|nr:ribonucleoside-diphosphate reductase subunit alpha [Clostridiales bacterium]
MRIVKRNGAQAPYDGGKIVAALQKAFASVGQEPQKDVLRGLLSDVEGRIVGQDPVAVEAIQDAAEQALMAGGFYAVARSYILYREDRARRRAAGREIADAVDAQGLAECLARVAKDFPQQEYGLHQLAAKYRSFEKADMAADGKLAALVKAAVELTTQEAPQWEFIAARLRLFQFMRGLDREMARRGVGGFYEKL